MPEFEVGGGLVTMRLSDLEILNGMHIAELNFAPSIEDYLHNKRVFHKIYSHHAAETKSK